MLNRFRRNKLIISSLSPPRAFRTAFGWWLEGKCKLKVFNIGNRLEKAFCNASAKRQNLNRQPWTAEEASGHTPTGQQTRRNLRKRNINKFKEPPTRRQAWTFHHKLILRQFLIFAKSRCCWPGFIVQQSRRVIDSHCVMQETKKKLNFEWFELVFLLRLFERIFKLF